VNKNSPVIFLDLAQYFNLAHGFLLHRLLSFVIFKTDFSLLKGIWPLLVTLRNWPERCEYVSFSYLNSVCRISGGRHLIPESQVWLLGGFLLFFFFTDSRLDT